uniref:GPALPP motifs-containing protein 1 n=1 Tax=Globodera pallida TaxID=36090 RepID=A0A183BNG1_GLOPA
MSYKPSNSNSAQVPSWDEFNLAQEGENTNQTPTNGFGIEQQEVGPYEPAPEEFGPNLPPESYDLDDPEDPLQGGVSAQKKLDRENAQATVLPKIVHQKSDEQGSLPSLSISSSNLADFVPMDQRPCSSSSIQCRAERAIGPALPPEFLAMTTQQIDEYDIGTALPPDEPQCSIGRERKKSDGANIHRKQKSSFHVRTNVGPTLPSSSDEEEEEEPKSEANGEEQRGTFGEKKEAGEREGGEEDDEMVGPMPPIPGRTEEEQAEYLGRLAQFEFNKETKSKELRREEWMTELPQKILKTGAFGLTAKSSFSRQTSDTPVQSDLWTKVPNGDIKKQITGAGPSTSSGPSTKRVDNEQREQQRADALNLVITESGERRPFDRDREIEAFHGEARCFRGKNGAEGGGELKERMGGDLSNRFGHGNDRKFL